MLINQDKDQTTDHVEFVSYTGKWPNLCRGILTLKIDGKEVTFGSKYANKNVQYESFWHSGGHCTHRGVVTDEWQINVKDLPEEFRKYAAEIDNVFNVNVEFGCCGGCK